VLIIDAELPFMSGIDFISTLIADNSLPFIPTILISANERDASRADVLDVPSLIAPFTAKELLDLVAATVARRGGKLVTADGRRASMRARLDELTVPIEPLRRPLRVVVADDEPDTVTSLMEILCHEGHSVFGTHHPADILPEVRANKPDAVVLDIDMPGISGFALAREIREQFGDSSPLLVAVSGKWYGQTDKMLAQLAGFDCFLQKPCEPAALLKLLEQRQHTRTPE
jgi:DNA-binding response OmpR family regulator